MTLAFSSFSVSGFTWGQDSKSCQNIMLFQVSGPDLHVHRLKQCFLNWISRLWLAWPIKGFHATPESATVTSLRPMSASVKCYKLIMVMMASPQKLGKVTRSSIKVSWMAGILAVYHSTMEIPVDWLITEPHNPCSLGDYCRKLATRPNGMCWWSVIFLRLPATGGTTLAHRVFLWSLVSPCGISM